MKRVILIVALLVVGMVGVAQAGPITDIWDGGPPEQAPEIDPNMVTGAVAALAGGLTVLRHSRRRK